MYNIKFFVIIYGTRMDCSVTSRNPLEHIQKVVPHMTDLKQGGLPLEHIGL